MKKKTLGQIMRDKWNNMYPRGSHLGLNGEEKDMLKRFEILLTENINVNNKIIIDYGCGGGFLGKHLLDNFNVKKYIAYDISDRSLKYAKKRLSKYNNTEFNLVVHHDIDFKNKKPDIICSFACLMHFPNKNYLDRYLKRFNDSEAKYIILEIRNKNIGTIFNSTPYENTKSIAQACITEPKYISEKLTNYKLYNKTDYKKAPTNCQILYYKKKTSDKNKTLTYKKRKKYADNSAT